MPNELAIEAYVVEHLPSSAPPNRATSPILPTGLTEQEVVIQWLKTKEAGDGRLADTTLAQYVVVRRSKSCSVAEVKLVPTNRLAIRTTGW
ncbi:MULTISPECIES: hypothetical protein [unclassified Burkholderia]|uniref:hypothetical protein n=1 Tax=unclassified Burkholderia TaxID=2613784 RepID=UPI0010F50198|nr:MULTISPECIES: hypothetical protein [unclassified Burkholderia]